MKIGAAEELELASARGDGALRKPVTVWVVRHNDDLYIRAVNGRTVAWFRGVQDLYKARIWVGVEKDVTFAETDDMNNELDAAYWTKGHGMDEHGRKRKACGTENTPRPDEDPRNDGRTSNDRC
ncbi:MAG: DUF2255 family protein [Actinomycetota bacterium]|nr:DUF2255 family protein [Actinomycetota bacterium]